MQFETVVLVTILAMAVTIAWFSMSKTATVTGLIAQVAAIEEDIKVSKTKDGEDIAEDGVFDVEPKRLLPGTEGYFDLYITSLKQEVTKASIRFLDYRNQYRKSDVTEEEKNEMQEILKGHIFFYMKENTQEISIANDASVYDEENPWIVDIKKDNPVQVRIYYKWIDNYDAVKGNTTEKDTLQAQLQYNEEDTKIGELIQAINFEFKVSPVKEAD